MPNGSISGSVVIIIFLLFLEFGFLRCISKRSHTTHSLSNYLSLFFLSVCPCPVPPIIEPFSFQDGLSEGMRTRTVCGVSRGDAPLSLHWLKDGQALPLLLGANITSLDQYSSLLSIPSLSATHSGEYTCVASNPAAEIKFTATLQVKGRVFMHIYNNKKEVDVPDPCLRHPSPRVYPPHMHQL